MGNFSRRIITLYGDDGRISPSGESPSQIILTPLMPMSCTFQVSDVVAGGQECQTTLRAIAFQVSYQDKERLSYIDSRSGTEYHGECLGG